MKKGTSRNGARGSEVPVGSWFEKVGAVDVQYVGDDEGPPDYLVRFGGDEVAVEVTRLSNNRGWPEKRRIAFERELDDVICKVANEKGAPRWHSWCEYDPCVPRPPKKRGAWRELVEQCLRTPGPGGEVQLIPDVSRVGRGVVLGYMPAGNAGSFTGVSEDMGIRPVGAVTDRVTVVVASKARKAKKGPRTQGFSRWWLVLDEEIVYVHSVLGREWSNVEKRVRFCEGIEQWNKVVLYNRTTGSWRAIHECDGEAALPVCGPAKMHVMQSH